MDIPELERIGLLKNDRTVYLALLEIGSATVSQLVKKIGLHRSYVYDILDKDFPFYQQSYVQIMTKELAEVIKDDVQIMAKKTKIEL